MQSEDNAAPHIGDVEVLGVELWRGERYDHRPMLPRAWELRATVRGWDAMYTEAQAVDPLS